MMKTFPDFYWLDFFFAHYRIAAKQRYSDTSYDGNPLQHFNDEKQRSESLPGPEQIISMRPYTGAISKIKTFEPKDASSQDSGINLSFQEDERKRTRNSIEKWVWVVLCDVSHA